MMRLLDLGGLAEKGIRFSDTHIWRLVRAGQFPQPVKIGKRSHWVEAEIDSYLKERRPDTESMHVYFIRVDGYIKIGFSRNVEKRIEAFEASSPHKIEVMYVATGGRSYEAALHRKFKHLRLRGEWFRPGLDLLAFIEKARS